MQDASNFAFVVRAVLLLPAWMQTNTSNFQASLNQKQFNIFPRWQKSSDREIERR